MTAKQARELEEKLRKLQAQMDAHERDCKAFREQPINGGRVVLTTTQWWGVGAVLCGAIWWASGTTEQIKNAMLQTVQVNSRIEALSQKIDNLFPRKR